MGERLLLTRRVGTRGTLGRVRGVSVASWPAGRCSSPRSYLRGGVDNDLSLPRHFRAPVDPRSPPADRRDAGAGTRHQRAPAGLGRDDGGAARRNCGLARGSRSTVMTRPATSKPRGTVHRNERLGGQHDVRHEERVMTAPAPLPQTPAQLTVVSPGEGQDLFGRTRECEMLDVLLGGLRAGRTGVLVVRGEAGSG